MKKFKTVTIQFKDEPIKLHWDKKWNRGRFNKELIKKVIKLMTTDVNSYSEFHDNEIVIKLF